MATSQANPILAAISPPRATASPDTANRTRCAYAICRNILRSACACEYAKIDPPCPERVLAAIEAEKILVGEG